MKKALKILGIVVLTIIILLLVAPFVFESQLKDLVKKTMNENLNAQVDFEDIDLSMFRSFPQATLVIEDLSIINKAPFEGDTLALSEEVTLEMSIRELFKSSNEPKKIDELRIDNGFVNIVVDSLGNTNYDIAIEDTTSTATGKGFSFDLKHYEINNSRLRYRDDQTKVKLDIEELNHKGTGDFSMAKSQLDTYSEALVSLDYDGTNYLKRHSLSLDAVFQMNLENNKYTFLENEARINQLPLTFEGYVQVNEEDTEMDLSFKTPSSDFKNFLAIIPEEYAKNIENVQTNGDFVVTGRIFGKTDDTYIPKMDIKINSDNASFKYPDLPKSVQDINIAMQVMNDTGIAEDTYVDIENLTFRIDQDRFAANGKLRKLTENMLVDLAIKGTVNLANISQAYPLELEQDLNGILTADVKTSFDMNSIEKEQYQKVNSSGTASIRDFRYSSPELPNEVRIASANMSFNQGNVRVPELKLTSGRSDLTASGNIENLIGFLFTDQLLKGNFQVNSNTFAVNDFIISETPVAENPESKKSSGKNTPKEAVKIPSFLDVVLNFNAKKVIYDNLQLENATGILVIRDETAKLEKVTTNIFDGKIGLNGQVSTATTTPSFNMDLDLNSLDIATSFNGLELMQNLAPLARALKGRLQSTINLKGNLNEDLTPQMASIAGNALAEVLTAEIDPSKTPLLNQLNNQLGFIDLDKIDLSKLKTQLSFNNGMVEIAPFDFKIRDINIQVAGKHGFDMNMDYDLKLDVPAKYLGSEVGSTLGKLSGEKVQEMNVALPIDLSGTFQNPVIKLNMQQAVNNLTQKIAEQQKRNLEDKAVKAINDILQGKRDPKEPFVKDSTRLDSAKTNTPAKRDSIARTQQEQVKNAAKDILGGILKNSKKKTDTTNKNQN